MRLVTNTVQPNQVQETNDKYIIKDVPFVRPMELSGGYVPEWSIKETANAWEGTVATLNHPRDNTGTPVPAERKPETHLGTITNPRFDGEHVRGNIELEKDRLSSGEAKDIERALESGDPIEVSSQYRPQELPPGEYDGEYRENVERIIEPDSVAILPNKTGVCSLEDGCGIQPEAVSANSREVSLTATDDAGNTVEDSRESMQTTNQDIDYALTDISADDIDDYTDDDWDGSAAVAALPNPSEDDDAPSVLDDTHAFIPQDNRDNKAAWKAPYRASPDGPVNTRALVAIKAAASGARGGFDEVDPALLDDVEAWANDLLQDAPSDLFGSMSEDEQEANGGMSWVVNALADTLFSSTGSGVDESGGNPGTDAATANNTTTMSEKTAELVANYGLDAENLPSEDTECFDVIYEGVTSNDTDDEQISNTGEYVTHDELDAMKDEIVDAVSSNADVDGDVKDDLASEVVANSAEYDDPESVLDDYPTEEALKAKRDTLTQDGMGMPAGGMGTQFSVNNDDADFDVSPGVLD